MNLRIPRWLLALILSLVAMGTGCKIPRDRAEQEDGELRMFSSGIMEEQLFGRDTGSDEAIDDGY